MDGELVYTLSSEQFSALVEVLSTEPAFSLDSSVFWVGLGSIIVGLTALVISVVEARRSVAGADAQLILKSFNDYQELYASLNKVRDLWQENQELLSKLPDAFGYDESFFDVLENHNQIDRERWGEVREVKIFFKSRYELKGKLFSQIRRWRPLWIKLV